MRQKIFQSILLGCMGMLIGTSLVFLFVLNQYFNASLKQELSVIADLIDDQDDVETIDWAKRSMEVVLKKKSRHDCIRKPNFLEPLRRPIDHLA